MPVAAPLTKRPLSVACTFNYLFRSMHLLLHILRNRLNKVKSKKLLMSSQFIIKLFLGISTIHYRKKHMIITVKNSIFFWSDDHHNQCGILVMVI